MQKRVTAIRLHPFRVWQQPNSADVSRLITDGVMLGIGGAPGVTLGTVKSVCTHYIYKIIQFEYVFILESPSGVDW